MCIEPEFSTLISRLMLIKPNAAHKPLVLPLAAKLDGLDVFVSLFVV